MSDDDVPVVSPNMRPLGVEHTARTQAILKQQGKDLSMDEIRRLRKSAFANIRKFMREAGLEVPGDDVELFRLLQAALKSKEQPR